MKKVDLKQMLREMGLNPILTEMPCVIEPLYKELDLKTLTEIKRRIQVSENGNGCELCGRKISLEKDGTATILVKTEYDAYKIKTNKLGIETSYEDGHPLYFSSYISRERGTVRTAFCNNGNGTGVWRTRFDTGSWSIQGAKGVKIRGDYDMPLDFDEEAALKEFDNMASSMIEDYPQTAEWYADIREGLVDTITREKDPIPRANLKIEALKKHISDLKKDNESLIQAIRIQAAILKRNLELLETVKDSSVGKLFFKDILQKYEEIKEGRLKAKTPTRFYKKTNSSPKIQELQDDTIMNLSETEEQELRQLKTKIKSLERKLAYLKATNKELNLKNNSLSDKIYFTRDVVRDFNKSSIFKKTFLRGAVKKYKQYDEKELYR